MHFLNKLLSLPTGFSLVTYIQYLNRFLPKIVPIAVPNVAFIQFVLQYVFKVEYRISLTVLFSVTILETDTIPL